MSGYDLKIRTKKRLHQETISFLQFLQRVGRKYPVNINYETIKEGNYVIRVDGAPGVSIDTLYQELILNKGLYYYKCSILKGDSLDIVRNVIIPIFQKLIELQFNYPQSRYLIRHIVGKPISDRKYILGDFQNTYSHEYEILMRKWDIKLLNDWEFIQDCDSLLTRFLLITIKHKPGSSSPSFNILVDNAKAIGIGMDSETADLFNKIHYARTQGLHRLKSVYSSRDLQGMIFQTYNYFQFFEDFSYSQKEKTTKLHGMRYRRIKFGFERWTDENGNPYVDEKGIPYDSKILAKDPCHDCYALMNQYHSGGCDAEQCPRCKGQYLGCPCKLMKDYD